jgi:hypothetical protein
MPAAGAAHATDRRWRNQRVDRIFGTLMLRISKRIDDGPY